MSEHPGGQDEVNPRQPVDVTLAAVHAAGESFGYSCYPGSDRMVFPWPDHRVTAYILGGHGVLADIPAALVLEGDLRRQLDLSRVDELAATINTWNRDRLGPTVSFRLNDEGGISLRTRATVQIRIGLSEEQLADALNQTMETTRLAVLALVDDFPELRFREDFSPEGSDPVDPRFNADQTALRAALPGALPDAAPRQPAAPSDEKGHGRDDDLGGFRDLFTYVDDPGGISPDPADISQPGGDHPSMSPRHRVPEPDESGDGAGELPYPVTLDRIRLALVDLGVSRTRGDDEVIVAWVNDVLFGFFLDNGPSYLVKGHWDPNLDPDRDFMRVFLLCNDWNEASINTKAFCHSDDEGLQVRVEFTASIGEGLNDAQLGHNTAVAINQVLHALDSISSDAIGKSVVHWPRRDDH